VPDRPVVIASNRGPVSFSLNDDGSIETGRGSGGLVSGLNSLGASGATWFAAAISAGDLAVARQGAHDVLGFELRLLEVEAERYRHAYDEIANSTLWFLHHGIWDLTREPAFDDAWRDAWASYRAMNEQFADALADHCEPGSIVLAQDYHLSLLGKMVTDRRPDIRAVHFHHTPFATPEELRVLPTEIRRELMGGLAGFHTCGFHTRDWAANFDAGSGDGTRSFVAPLGIDADTLLAESSTDACNVEVAALDRAIGDRQFIVRVDRIELSKNLLRGFDAFELLLQRSERWRGRVVFGAHCYPSREGVPAYARYRDDIVARVAEINDRWGDADWTPILLETDDNYLASLAALRRADVVVVNPVRDGLNLVAKEAMIVNDRGAGLILSDRAGSWDEMSDVADGVNPFDVSATTDAIEVALRRDPTERATRGAALRAAAARRTPSDWLADQLAAADR
jgi:trehalose 6-phosphate synthase